MGGSDIRIKIPVQAFFHNCIAAGNRHVRAFRKACPVCGQEFGGHYRSPAESVFKASQDFPRRPRNLLRLYRTHCTRKSACNLLSRLRGGGNPAGRFHAYASRPCPCHAPREIIPPRGLRWRPHPSGAPPPWTIRPRQRTGGAVWIFPRTGFVFRRANGKFKPRLRPPAHIDFNAAESSQPPRPCGRAFASSLLEGFRRQFRGVEYVENLVRPRDFKDKPRL